MGADDLVVRALMVDRAAAGVPRGADDVDGLGERIDRLARGEPRAADGRDGIPERAGSKPQLDASPAEDVEACDAAREHDRRSQRDVRDVRGDPHVGRLRGDEREQRPGIEEASLVRVILERDQVEAEDIGELRELEHRIDLPRRPG